MAYMKWMIAGVDSDWEIFLASGATVTLPHPKPQFKYTQNQYGFNSFEYTSFPLSTSENIKHAILAMAL